MAWIQRFITNARRKGEDQIRRPYVTTEESTQAKYKLFQITQQTYSKEVVDFVKRDVPLPKGHALHGLLITTSDEELVVISTRLRNTESPKTPQLLIFLSPKAKLTHLLIETLHKIHGHAGVSALQAIISSSYYIPSLQNIIKKVSRTCRHCRRAYAQPLSQQMGMLPAFRTTPAPPFYRTGVDFVGPF